MQNDIKSSAMRSCQAGRFADETCDRQSDDSLPLDQMGDLLSRPF